MAPIWSERRVATVVKQFSQIAPREAHETNTLQRVVQKKFLTYKVPIGFDGRREQNIMHL